jgi:small-conductance mechanosensitive channel
MEGGMSDFEFVFALYSLLLGLSMVELLGGLGRAIEARFAAEAERERFAIGWLTPLLAVFVMLDLLSFWSAAWVARDDIAVSNTTLMAVAGFASLYFLAARLVFPSHPEGFADLDVHYFRVRRIVLGLLLILLAAQLGYYLAQPDLAANLARPLAWIMTLILVALMVAAMCVKSPRWSALLLAALVARYVVIYLL